MTNSPADLLRATLSADEIDELRRLGMPVHLPTGAVLFAEGETTTHAILIHKGHVKVVSAGPHGQEIILATRGPSEIVGEMAPLDGLPRSATVIATTPVEAAVVSAEAFNDFLDTHPRVMKFLLQQVVRRLRDADHRRMDLATLGVAERVAAVLLELARDPADDSSAGLREVTLSQHELASHVGASREAVAKALRQLRDNATISTSRRAISIKDPAALRRLISENTA